GANAGTGAAFTVQREGSARSGDDLSEVPGERSATEIRHRRGARGRLASVAGVPANLGSPGGSGRAGVAVVQATAGGGGACGASASVDDRRHGGGDRGAGEGQLSAHGGKPEREAAIRPGDGRDQAVSRRRE